MSDTFECKYTVADGYARQSGRPHSFTISADDLDDDMDETDLGQRFTDEMDYAFAESIRPEESNEDEFVAWARAQLAAREKE